MLLSTTNHNSVAIPANQLGLNLGAFAVDPALPLVPSLAASQCHGFKHALGANGWRMVRLLRTRGSFLVADRLCRLLAGRIRARDHPCPSLQTGLCQFNGAPRVRRAISARQVICDWRKIDTR